MRNKIIYFLVGSVFFAGVALAAPNNTFQRNILPEVNQMYDLGSTTPNLQWKGLYVKDVFISGTCTGCSTGLTSYDAWTHPLTGWSATTSIMRFAGLVSTASSTFQSTLRLPSLSDGDLAIYAGTVGSYASTTFSSPLIYTTGNVTCPTCTVGGLTSYDAWTHGTLFGSAFSATSTQLHLTGTPSLTASSTVYFGTAGIDLFFNSTNGRLGLSSSTPGSILSLGSTGGINFRDGTTATSTFPGHVTIGGNLQVNGNAAFAVNLQASTLTSALLLTDASGNVGEYAGTSCTNQFVRSLSVLGAATCSSINNGDWSGTDLAVTNGGTGLSTFGGTNHILYTTAADTLSSEAAFLYNPTANRLTTDYASSTSISTTGSIFGGTSTGWLSFGSTTPWATLAINPIAGVAANRFVIGSSTGTSLILSNGGNFGFGTTSPWGNFAIEADTVDPSFVVSDSAASVPYFFIQSATNNGKVGIGTTSPFANFAINPVAGAASNQFVIGSSTATSFLISNRGYLGMGTTSPFARFTLDNSGFLGNAASSTILATEYRRNATSTTMTIAGTDGNQQLLQIGTSATTITLNVATFLPGQKLILTICNPGGTAGAITWATSNPANGLLWAGGTAPTQTTTASKCDVWSFLATQATSTLNGGVGKILGAASVNF